MDEVLLYLFAMYGISFGLQHKLPGLWNGAALKVFKSGFLDNLLSCTYCVGFHAGWMVYILSAATKGWDISVGALGIYAFAGASFSYAADAVVQKLEGTGAPDEIEYSEEEEEEDHEDSEEG